MKTAYIKDGRIHNNVLWLLSGAATVLVLAFVTLPFFREGQSRQTPIAVVEQYPDQFSGNDIFVTGTVQDQIGQRGLVVKQHGLTQRQILVLSNNPLTAVGGSGDSEELFAKNKNVTVSGRVEVFNIENIEDEIGFDLNDSDFASWNGKPVIIADSINDTPQ